jgi:hypothetical protein
VFLVEALLGFVEGHVKECLQRKERKTSREVTNKKRMGNQNAEMIGEYEKGKGWGQPNITPQDVKTQSMVGTGTSNL